MTPLAILFLLATTVSLFGLPRQWAPLPLLVGACYMTLGQGIHIGPFSFPVLRLILLVGFVRVIARGEKLVGGMMGMDRLMIWWAVWALVASAFRTDPSSTLTFHLGMVYNTCGFYFLIRCFCQSEEDVVGIIKVTALLLAPVALEMVQEQLTHRNLFSIFGGVPEESAIRQGRLRSQGPFAHAILAGTVGAVCAPLMIGIWRKHPLIPKIGLASCLLMVLASASSGPLMSLIFSSFALILWRWRHLTRQMRLAAVAGYFLLSLVMKAPVYYLIARIDVAGGSTGFHRARLIDSAFQHVGEWWLAGTDYTRHWMPYGVSWSPDHADITNHYIAQGVKGGLPLMFLFIAIVVVGFRYIGLALDARSDKPVEDRFLIWALGASLFAHATTCISVAYFDQTFVFLYLILGVATSLCAVSRRETPSFDNPRLDQAAVF